MGEPFNFSIPDPRQRSRKKRKDGENMAEYGFVTALKEKETATSAMVGERVEYLRALVREVRSGQVKFSISSGSVIVRVHGVGVYTGAYTFVFDVDGQSGEQELTQGEAMRAMENLCSPASMFVNFLGHADAKDVDVERLA